MTIPELPPAQRVGVQHPGWVPGITQTPPFKTDKMHTLDPAGSDSAAVYPLVISAVAPRPIGFVCTQSTAGVVNLAPYSFFNVMSHNPPTLTLGIGRSIPRGGDKKDTLTNIEETKELVVHIISEWCLEAANHTCGDFPPSVNELEVSGFTTMPSVKVGPPRVKECAVQMECKLLHIHNLRDRHGAPSGAIVIAEIVMFHVADGVAGLSPGGHLVVDPFKMAPVSRFGGHTYGLSRVFVDLPRPNAQGVYKDGHAGPDVDVSAHEMEKDIKKHAGCE
ncbi:MAG: hypothetical protein WDW36_005907 [Sanguina aurantia]